MKRLACLTVFAAACGGSGFETAPATMTGINPMVQSASATSFNAADGSGTMLMGWKISLWQQGDGADCMSNDTVRARGSIDLHESTGRQGQESVPRRG